MFEPPYGVSFPPLLPALIAVWNAISRSGPYGGMWIGAAAALGTLPLLVLLSRRLAASDGPAILTAAALFGHPWYLDEVMGGRAMPVGVLLFCLLLLLLHRALTIEARPARAAAAAGLVAGLLFNVRFEFLLPGIAIAAALAAGRTREGSRLTGGYIAGLAAGAAPWIVYSLIHFRVPLASEHVRTAAAVASPAGLRFVPFPEILATLRDAPFEWVAAKVAGSWPAIEAMAIALGASAVPALTAMWAATRRGAQALPRETAIVLVLGWVALAVQFAVTGVLGYGDVRFAIPIVMLATFTVAAALCNGSEIPHAGPAAFLLLVPAQVVLLAAAAGHPPDRSAGLLSCLWPATIVAFVVSESAFGASRALARLGGIAAVAVPLAALGIGSLVAARTVGTGYSLAADATTRTWPANQRILDGLDGADPARARILLVPHGAQADGSGASPAVPMAGEFGARTRVTNVLKPTAPFGWVDLWLLVQRYGITHAMAGDPEIDSRLPVLFAVHKSSNGALWAIDGVRPGLVVVDRGNPVQSISGLKMMLLVRNDGPIDPAQAPPRTPDEWPYPLLLVPRN